MVGPGEQAVWDMGGALVLVERPLPGDRVTVCLVHRDWDGEEREDRHVLTRAADGWAATPPLEGRETAATLEALLPAICARVAPAQLGPLDGGAAPF